MKQSCAIEVTEPPESKVFLLPVKGENLIGLVKRRDGLFVIEEGDIIYFEPCEDIPDGSFVLVTDSEHNTSDYSSFLAVSKKEQDTYRVTPINPYLGIPIHNVDKIRFRVTQVSKHI